MTEPIPDTVLEECLAVIGRIGSGKTYAAKGRVERLLSKGRRVCIIDPNGSWYGPGERLAGRGR